MSIDRVASWKADGSDAVSHDPSSVPEKGGDVQEERISQEIAGSPEPNWLRRGFRPAKRTIDAFICRHPIASIVLVTAVTNGLILYGFVAETQAYKRGRLQELYRYVESVDGVPGIGLADLGDFARRARLDSAQVVADRWEGLGIYLGEGVSVAPYSHLDANMAPGDRALDSYKMEAIRERYAKSQGALDRP
jgi:hypothetical protein